MNQSVTPLNSVSQFSPFSNHRINYLKQSISREKNNILTWSCFALFVIYLFHFQSDGDFSFLLTLSSIIQSFGFVLVLYKVTSSHSVEGISLKSLILYLVVSSTRLLAVLLSDAYLPYDRSGDWLYRCTEGIGTVAIVALLLSIRKYRYTYYSFIDSFAGIDSKKSWKWITLLLVALIIYAEFIHPGLSQHHAIDVLWSFSHYVEAIAVYPQLLLFSRSRKGEVESFTSHFVFALAVSRCLTFLFWCSCWKELNTNTHFMGSLLAGRSVLLSQILQLFLMANYVYYYVKSVMNGTPLILPIYRRSREE